MNRRALAFLALSLVLVVGWGGAARADAQDVVVSEIMYNPENDLGSDEFLELHNTGDTTVDISGWCVDGISFCFPAGSSIAAGEFLVLSPDAARLAEVYGVSSAGTYDGGLKNGGEDIALLDAGGNVIHAFEYDDRGPWPVLPDGEGPSLELGALDARSSAWGWFASTAPAGHTAGAPNSVVVAGQPSSIEGVSQSVVSPADGVSVTVTASVLNATATPSLQWRVNLGAFQSMPMTGTAPDYSATIPGQATGDLVEYRIETEGAFGHSWPRVDDSRSTLGVFYPRNVQSAVPVFEWFMDDGDYESMITDHLFDDMKFDAVLVVGDEVMTGTRVRVRGSASRNNDKVNFKWEFPQGHDLEAPDLFIEPIDEFAMQAELSDRSYGRSLLTWRAYEMVGIPAAQTFKIRVERNGEFQGLYSYVDIFDGTWRERFDIEEAGSFYKTQSSAFDQNKNILNRWDLKEGVEGYAPLEEMLAAILDGTEAEREAYVRANFDIPQIIDYAVVTALAEHVDSASKNFYVFKPDATGLWQMIPWDLDHTWGNRCCPVFSEFVTPAEPGDKVNKMIEAVLAIPEFETAYFVRAKELRDQILADGLLEGIFDAEVSIAAPEAILDKAKWGQCCSVSYDRNQLFGDIQARRDAFDNDPRVPGNDPDPDPDTYECVATISGNSATISFAGPRGTREQLRSVEDGWIATVTGLNSFTVTGQSDETFFVRLKGNGYNDDVPFTDVTCTTEGDPDPQPDDYECTVTTAGSIATLEFAGPRGRSEQLRSVESGWIARVEGVSTYTAVGQAGDSFYVRLRGNGYSDAASFTDIPCAPPPAG